MKTAKRIFFILTVVCGALAVVFDIAAVCMQVQVSGEKLLTMDSHWGYILAVNYRWVTLTAVILTVSALAMLTAYILYRRKRKKDAQMPRMQVTSVSTSSIRRRIYSSALLPT